MEIIYCTFVTDSRKITNHSCEFWWWCSYVGWTAPILNAVAAYTCTSSHLYSQQASFGPLETWWTNFIQNYLLLFWALVQIKNLQDTIKSFFYYFNSLKVISLTCSSECFVPYPFEIGQVVCERKLKTDRQQVMRKDPLSVQHIAAFSRASDCEHTLLNNNIDIIFYCSMCNTCGYTLCRMQCREANKL